MSQIAAHKPSMYDFIFWISLAGVGSYFVWPLKDHLKLGIDLVGGFYITLKVKTEEAIRTELVEKMRFLMRLFDREHKAIPTTHKIDNNTILFSFSSSQDLYQVVEFIQMKEPTLLVHVEDKTITIRFPQHVIKKIEDYAVQSNVDVLRKRLDKTGVSEISISRQGERNIIVELPHVDDPARAKKMIGKSAHLEIKLVERAASNEDDLLDDYDGQLPDGMMIVQGADEANSRGKKQYLLSDYTDITGKSLKDAQPALGGMTGTQPVVAFELTADGAEKFYDLTSKNVGRQLAIVIDNKVISAPEVHEAIHGNGRISGNFTWKSARDLAMLLKSGAFVAPVSFEEERRIGPSLGSESIRQGIISCIVGLGLLFVFSLFYYKMSGLLAFLALIYNLLLILFGLAWLRATLTLPGIAGMVLTVGMAIDASILIYEKVKEVLKTGVTFRKAVNTGFSDAMVVILDANITTFLTGIVLYKFGTGPIQGFAVTLMLGIVSTLITGLFFLRSLFNTVFRLFNVQRISI